MSKEDCLEDVEPELSLKEPLRSCCVSELWLSARHPFDPPDIPRKQELLFT